MTQKNLKVLIIGGGIGGLCLAHGLKKAGIHFEVFERNRDNSSWLEGYRINISTVGSSALFQCLPRELWEAFLAGAGDPHESLGFMTEKLQEMLVVDSGMRVGHSTDPARQEYAASRKMLRYILQAGLEAQTLYNKAFVKYEQLPDGKIKAFFEDGTSAIGDLLIGADGANSRVRQQLLPHAQRVDTDAAATAGKLVLTDTTRKWLPDAISSRMNVVMPLNKYFFFNAVFDHKEKFSHSTDQVRAAAAAAGIDPDKFVNSSEDYVLWSLVANKREFEKELNDSHPDIAASVLAKIEGWHPVFQRMVRESDPSSLSVFPLKAMRPYSNWKPTNVTLLGDAAHNMPPLRGMGANMALHDAVMLYKWLMRVAAGECQLAPALQAYQEKMLKDGFKALRASVDLTRQASHGNFLQRWFARGWFHLCNAIAPLKQKSFGPRWEELVA